MKPKPPIKIEEGMVFVCETLSWHDGWEFDHPSMMLSPVIRTFENGANHEQIVESVMIDAVVDGEMKSQDFEKSWGWRGYKLPVLRRRFREALAGKCFPKACYHAERSVVKIVPDTSFGGGLIWEDVPQ